MKLIKALFSRMTIMIVIALIEILMVIGIFYYFREQAIWLETVLRVLSVLVILNVVNYSRHLSGDLLWVILIFLFPVAGTFAYFLIGANLILSRTMHKIVRSQNDAKHYYEQSSDVMQEAEGTEAVDQFRYLWHSAGFPVYRNESFDYYKAGELGYPVMLEELKKAEKFIFMEYFIVEEGRMWNGILDILKQKAAEGLDVRVMYDDLGSFNTLPATYAAKLEKSGIKCQRFNKINPVIGAIMNHRDHRKILVIDGKTAFSGGVNIADEYINTKEKYGYWKDNMIRVK